jgi:RNA polymerase sigma factor (sigma-70 family)
MNPPADDLEPSPLTRASLLLRLRDWQDAVSWTEFYHLYFKLIYRYGRRAGLNHGEAEEVAQDVFQSVAGSIAGFAPQNNRGSFRRWLLNLTRWRVIDFRRQEDALAPRIRARLPALEDIGPGLIEALPDPAVVEEESWEIDWRSAVLEIAMQRMAKKVPAKKFQAFELYHRRHWSVSRISHELGINPAGIYLINHRMTRRLKKEVARLSSQIG